MKKIYYIILTLGILMILAGISLEIIKESCYCKTPRDFYQSEICKLIIKE